MPQGIQTICLLLPFHLSLVNCYLIDTGSGHVLIDTGSSNRRADLERELEGAGCKPGSLKLIVLTHGDFDHTGNAAYLRGKLGAKTAMHREDAGMIERGDMFFNRKRPNALIRALLPLVFGLGKSDRFKPDVYLEDGYDLSPYGFEARVLHIPGHSKGSIGVLTARGDLFCGDLLENTAKPALNAIMDDLTAANTSVARLRGMSIATVYPGHGKPFAMELFIQGAPA